MSFKDKNLEVILSHNVSSLSDIEKEVLFIMDKMWAGSTLVVQDNTATLLIPLKGREMYGNIVRLAKQDMETSVRNLQYKRECEKLLPKE